MKTKSISLIEAHYYAKLSDSAVEPTRNVDGAMLSVAYDGAIDPWAGIIDHGVLEISYINPPQASTKFVEMRYDSMLSSGIVSIGDIVVFHLKRITANSYVILNMQIIKEVK